MPDAPKPKCYIACDLTPDDRDKRYSFLADDFDLNSPIEDAEVVDDDLGILDGAVQVEVVGEERVSFVPVVGRQVTSDITLGLRSIGHLNSPPRSEERRVGKECRSRWSPYH